MKPLSPNDLGKNLVVEDCRKIRIDDFLHSYLKKIKALLLSAELEANGLKIELATSQTHNNGTRYWFRCICKARVAVIYQHPLTQALGCRNCIGLRYRKQRFKGMIEGLL